MNTLKEAFSEMTRLCSCLDSASLQVAILAIEEEVDSLEDHEVERLLSLVSEVLTHVNDLDDEIFEQQSDIIHDIHEMADQIREDADRE